MYCNVKNVNENIYGDYLPAKDAHHKARTGHRHRPFESTSPELFCLTNIGFLMERIVKWSIGVWVKKSTDFEI